MHYQAENTPIGYLNDRKVGEFSESDCHVSITGFLFVTQPTR